MTPILENLISANSGAGIELSGMTTNGSDPGEPDRNRQEPGWCRWATGLGVYIQDAVGNTIGGTTPADRNIISGNTNLGIQLFRVSSPNTASGFGNVIEGNYIGTDSKGTSALGNGASGIGVFLNDNEGGVGDLVSNNVIAANGLAGVEITGNGPSSFNPNQVVNNKIGTDVNGLRLQVQGAVMSPITVFSTTAPQQIGVLIQGSYGNTIGGTGSNGNLIEDNLAGVEITGINGNFGAGVPSANTINASPGMVDRVLGNMLTGNLIGIYLIDTTDNMVAGNTIKGNASSGMTLLGTMTSGNLIEGNTITGNTGVPEALVNNPIGTGIYIEQAQHNSILDNTISNNPAAGLYLFNRAQGNVAQRNTIMKNGYGMLVYNSGGNADSLRRAPNQNAGNRIADFREFTGPVTARTGTQPAAPPAGPKVKGRALSRHHHR